jgi:hypothetical protein
MKKIFLAMCVTVIGITLIGCHKDPQAMSTEGNDIQVEFLFEKDGVKVYRFHDGRYHYFTTRGETMSTYKSDKTNFEENIQ